MGEGKGPQRIHKRIHTRIHKRILNKKTQKDSQKDSQQDSQKDSQRIHKKIHKGFTTERDNSGTTAGQQRDNSRTTARQQRDNSGTTAGQPGQQRDFFFHFPPDVFHKKCVALLGPPASRADPPLRLRYSLAKPGENRWESLTYMAGGVVYTAAVYASRTNMRKRRNEDVRSNLKELRSSIPGRARRPSLELLSVNQLPL